MAFPPLIVTILEECEALSFHYEYTLRLCHYDFFILSSLHQELNRKGIFKTVFGKTDSERKQ
jgi:hypothetical protein